MSSSRLRLAALPWHELAPGCRVKQLDHGRKRFRVVEFTDSYDDSAWCAIGHSGFVLEGRLTFCFDDTDMHLEEGDAFEIEHGPASRHRTRIDSGRTATLFLVEHLNAGS